MLILRPGLALALGLLTACVGELGAPGLPGSDGQRGAQSAGILGYVDGLSTGGGGTVLGGWTCLTGHATPLEVHLYVGGPYGSGTIVRSQLADLVTEPAVNSVCSTPTSVRHRFALRVDDLAPAHAGKTLWVHAIHPLGGVNPTVANSGTFTVPASPGSAPAPDAGSGGAPGSPTFAWSPQGGALLGDGDPAGAFYRYAPSVVQTDGNTKHLYWCANRDSGDVTDHIIHRQLTLSPWSWTAEQVMLCPGSGQPPTCERDPAERYTRFDGRHVCDPELLQGTFRMSGTSYQYALFYLGSVEVKQSPEASCASGSQCASGYRCNEWGSCVTEHCSVGVAFSNSLTGPFTKYPQPLIAYPSTCNGTCWGNGQPTATLVKDGALMLVYSSNESPTNLRRRLVDLSDFDGGQAPTTAGPAAAGKGPVLDSFNGQPIPPLDLTGRGLIHTETGGEVSWFANVSIAYNQKWDVFFMLRDGDWSAPYIVAPKWQVAWIPASYLWSGGAASWTVLTTRDAAGSFVPPHAPAFTFVNNGGLQRNTYGAFYDPQWLEVFPTRMTGGQGGSALWTYRTQSVNGPLTLASP